MSGPFDEYDEDENTVANHLGMAEELDCMETDVSSWEAEFLESILNQLRSGTSLTEKQVEKLDEIYEKYLR